MKISSWLAILAISCLPLAYGAAIAQTVDDGQALNKAFNEALLKADAAQGLKLASQLLDEREKQVGDSPQLIPALRWRGYFRALGGDVGGATADFNRSYVLGERFLGANEQVLTDAALASVLAYLAIDRDLIFSLLADHPDDPKLAQTALGISRAQKGRTIEAIGARMARLRLQAKGPYKAAELRALLADIGAAESEYQKLVFSTASPFGQDVLGKLAELERKITSDQKAMIGNTGLVALLPDANQTRYNPELLAQAANPGMGNWAIDYVEFQRYRFGRSGFAAARSEYAGLLLRADGRIVVAMLGPSSDIDAFAVRLHGTLADPASDYLPIAREGYARLVAPLVTRSEAMGSEVGGVAFVNRALSIFPDGNLNLVPFAALHDGTSFLVDRFEIGYLTSGLDAGLFAPMALKPSFSVQVFADPDFTNTLPAGGAEHSRFGILRSDGLEAVPATKLEAEAIRKLVPAAGLSQRADASRSNFLNMSSPGILHIASHGQYFDEALPPPQPSATGAMPVTGGQDFWLRSLVDTALVLAGDGQDPMGGLVTALDVLGLDLSSTQLVVLSACDTARGAIRPGDAVYGLRYAFRVAGAETVVATLWEIEDQSAKSLMARYYGDLFRGVGRRQALTQAMRFQKQRTPHPVFWAAFTVAGSFNALRGAPGAAIPVFEPPRGMVAVHSAGQAPPAAPPEPPAALYPAGKPPVQVVQDCPDCPPLVAVQGPGGALLMGKFEVTFDEWSACEADKGCAWHPTSPFYGRGKRPVINVSWHDIEQYLAWLSKKTGKDYRLPTAAEWQFAARGGGEAPIQAGPRTATCWGCGPPADGNEPTPVGSHEANALGLHDMLGNVWEVTSDCRDPTCKVHSLRGGSYFESFDRATSESVSTAEVNVRLNTVGFRVVRSAAP